MKKNVIISAVLLLSGCTAAVQATVLDASKNSAVKMPETETQVSLEHADETASPELDNEAGDAVIWELGAFIDRLATPEDRISLKVVGRVLTIDGCSNYWPDLEMHGGTYTYGTLEVLKAVKGDVREGDIVPFAIAGGTVPYEDYAKSLDPVVLEKQIRVAEENGMEIPEMVTTRYFETELNEESVYFMVSEGKMDLQGDRYLILPYPETFMLVDADSLGSDKILAYNTDYQEWWDINDLKFPEKLGEPYHFPGH